MNIGKIVQVIGNVVDVEFPEDKLPEILTAIAISNPTISDEEDNLIVEAAQHLGDNLSLIHISEPTRPPVASRMPSSA